MTPRDLQTFILSGPLAAELAPHVHTAALPKIGAAEARAKDQAVADLINAAGVLRRVTSRPIGVGTVLNALGPADGAAVLDALYALAATVRPVHYALMLLERGELDVGLPATRAQIDVLVGVALSAEQAGAIKALAEEPETISAAEVSVALRGPWE